MQDLTLTSLLAGIESECRPNSRRYGGRFPVGIVAGFGRNTQFVAFGKIRTASAAVKLIS